MFYKSLLPVGEKYLKFLREFKIFLSTPSAKGLIGTRFFEIMASKTLLFIPESTYYDNLFIPYVEGNGVLNIEFPEFNLNPGIYWINVQISDKNF